MPFRHVFPFEGKITLNPRSALRRVKNMAESGGLNVGF